MSKSFTPLTALLIVLVALAGCGGAGPTAQPQAVLGGSPGTPVASYPPPIPAGNTVSITFANYNLATAGLGKEATEELINGFMAANPNIKVEGRAISSNDVAAKIQAEVVAGNAPDVVQGVFADLDFIVRDLRAVAIQEIVPPAEIETWRGGEYPMSPNGLKLGELDGSIYGVPYTFSTPTLFYNADLFAAAGLDPNKPPTTWAEVKEQALQLKGRTGKEGIAIECLGQFDWCWQGLVRSNGGRVLSEDRRAATFASPEAVGAATMWQDLVGSGAHPKLTGNDVSAAFQGGNLGMILTTSARQSSFLAAAKGKFALRSAKMPAFAGKPTVPTNSGSGLFILSRDPLKQRAAWELMKYITSERGYTIITSKIGYLPLRTGIVNDDRYLKGWVAENPLVQPNLEQLQVMEPWVAWPGSNYRQSTEVMMKAVEEVVYGGAPAEATLKAAQERAQGLMPRR
jgi:multiple sugar transport system substrate-binding protein